jgi:hypothetical protein
MKQQDRVLPLGKDYGVEVTMDGKARTDWWFDLVAALQYAGSRYDPKIHTRLRIITADGVVMLDTEQQTAAVEVTNAQ